MTPTPQVDHGFRTYARPDPFPLSPISMSAAEVRLVRINFRKVKWIVLWILLAVLFIAAALVVGGVAFLDSHSWITGRRLSAALRGMLVRSRSLSFSGARKEFWLGGRLRPRKSPVCAKQRDFGSSLLCRQMDFFVMSRIILLK